MCVTTFKTNSNCAQSLFLFRASGIIESHSQAGSANFASELNFDHWFSEALFVDWLLLQFVGFWGDVCWMKLPS